MSIAVACPHCEAKLNLRDEMAGRRGKCPKCSQPIDIPAAAAVADKPVASPPTAAAPAVSTFTDEQIGAVVREAVSGMTVSPVGKGATAALVCRITRGLHYFLPVLFGGLLAWHVLMNGSWARGEAGTPGAIVYSVLFVLALVLMVMSMLSHCAPRLKKLKAGAPLSQQMSPVLIDLIDGFAKRFEVPSPKCVAVWDASLHQEQGELRIGASLLDNLTAAEVTGMLVRELAVERNAGRRLARQEFIRLRRLQGDREPGESATATDKLITGLGMLGRPIVWPMMVMVRSVAEVDLKQAEFDADALACEIVGSRAFLTTLQRQRLVNYSVELATSDLPFQFREKSLHGNRLPVVRDNLKTLPQEVQQTILETPVDEPRAGDYHPTWNERIAAIQQLASPGVLKCGAPARHLVTDFDQLCRDVTWLDASQRFGATLKRRDLKA